MWFKISSLKLNVDNRCLFYTDQDTGGSIISRLICLMSDGILWELAQELKLKQTAKPDG